MYLVYVFSKGLRFGNVAVLLEGVKDVIRDMKYCWYASQEWCLLEELFSSHSIVSLYRIHKNYFMCRQESVFRVNCIDCLDRTNLVQSVFATSVIETQVSLF